MSVTAIRLEMDTEQMQKIFGMQDAYIKKLEQDFQVTIVDRNGWCLRPSWRCCPKGHAPDRYGL